MVKITGCKLEVPLEAQMPMIHFQSEQCGVTLRATEVKPKLDHFIVQMLMRETGDSFEKVKQNKEYKDWFLDAGKHDALDYKMQITVANPPEIVELGLKTPYSMYYGNMGENTEKKYGVISNPLVTIVCFKESLRKKLAENIEQFFLITNFGTMQNKGFGSFAPKGWAKGELLSEKEQNTIAKYYKEIGAAGCFCMPFKSGSTMSEMSEAIKSYYGIMKSGQNFRGYARSYIYEYMHEKFQMGNEKAWMKQNGIAPIVCREGNEKRHMWTGSHKHYYVRALLGIGEKIEFATDLGMKNKKEIKISSDDFDRMSSPIYFKPIKNVVFIIGFPVPDEIYDKTFLFAGEALKTPAKEKFGVHGFDMCDFLKAYRVYFNGELRDKVRIKCPKVVQLPRKEI